MSNGNLITTRNWNKAPNIRWSFQHMQALFPTCRLQKGSGAASEFGDAASDLSGITYTGSNGETGTVKKMLDDSHTDSFLVVKSGAIVSEQYFNNMTLDSHHLLNSVSKSFVGMLGGIAVARGQLNPDERVAEYLPGLNNSAWEGATVRHLLDMTAGAKYTEDYADPETDFWKETAVVGWKPELVDESTPETLYDYAKSLRGKDQEHGERFHYRTVTTNVIGMIIEKVMGRRLGELLADEVWSQLSPRNDANVVVDKVGGLYVGAGMSACTRDLACFGMMMANNGLLNGRQIIPASWIEDTIAGEQNSKRNYMASEYAELGCDHYRNQVWVKDASKGVMMALGIHGQIIYIDQGNDVVMVKLSTQPESVDLEMFLNAFAAMDAIAENLS